MLERSGGTATAAVIGAGDYIGAAIARRFAAEGFTVVAGRRKGEKLAPLVAEIEARGGRAVGRSLDARKEDEVVAFLQQADALARLEVCIFNVDANVQFPLLETSERVELSANNRAIQRQYELMQKTAEHAEVQTQAIAANELHARQDTFIELAKLVGQQLEVISGLLYLSSQGPAGDGVISDQELDALWARMSSGESSIFSRRLISLRFRSADGAEARAFFWGTPIRARHSENFIFSFERLLRAAADCDPDGMIVDALVGNAQGRVYDIMRNLRGTPSAAPHP